MCTPSRFLLVNWCTIWIPSGQCVHQISFGQCVHNLVFYCIGQWVHNLYSYWSMRAPSRFLLVNKCTILIPIGQCVHHQDSFWSTGAPSMFLLVNVHSYWSLCSPSWFLLVAVLSDAWGAVPDVATVPLAVRGDGLRREDHPHRGCHLRVHTHHRGLYHREVSACANDHTCIRAFLT